MAHGTTYINDLLKMIMNAVPIPNLADNAATGPLTQLYLGLHTADPGAGGSQTTSEVTVGAYVGYARKAVNRAAGAGGFTVTGPTWNLTDALTSFPPCTGGTGATITHFSVGTAATGAGKVLYSGTVTPNIAVANGVTPQLSSSTQDVET